MGLWDINQLKEYALYYFMCQYVLYSIIMNDVKVMELAIILPPHLTISCIL